MIFNTPDDFAALVAPPSATPSGAWWFIFSGNTLLVAERDGSVALPACDDPVQLGLPVTRRLYLGRLGDVDCRAVEVPDATPPPDGMDWRGLRALFGRLDDTRFSIAGRAVQIIDWDRTHQFCGRCGTGTEARAGERARECPQCRLVVYPRLAPAVMALVRDGRRILLARSPHFAKGMYSALAGFVEPGESLEQCLAREVREEVGVEVANVRYFASQSWPFPHSLMVAFTADYAGGALRPDPSEIEDAGWFEPEALPQLPGRISISRRLIDAVLTEITGRSPR